jgi:hypothetical protein
MKKPDGMISQATLTILLLPFPAVVDLPVLAANTESLQSFFQFFVHDVRINYS